VPALLQLHRLQRAVRRRLAAIQQPLLIVQGRVDIDIDLRGVDALYREVGSSLKEIHWMEASNHVVILDGELEQVTAITLRFMERVLKSYDPFKKRKTTT
jgi:carboxylesterase